MTAEDDDILDDLFHGCAFAAYIDQAIEEGGPPDCERTRRRAFRYYEEALAERHSRNTEPKKDHHATERRAIR